MKNFFKQNWALILILFVAIFFRFWQINSLPGGLFPDEAANGLDINSIFHGHLQPFYERGNGREALFFYFEAFSVLLFGRGVWQFHIVSSVFSFAAVLAAYFVTKRLFNKQIALLATFFMASSSFAVDVGRTAFRANAVPLFSILTVLFLVKFFQTDESLPAGRQAKYWSAILAGISFGLGFYTYISFRMMLPLLFGYACILLLGFRSQIKNILREYTKYVLTFLAALAASIAWLVIYFIHNPANFVGRAGNVSVFNKDLNHGDLIGTVILVAKKTIMGFFTQGDIIWRHNVSGFPFLTPLISPFFAVALIIFIIASFRLIKQIWKQQLETNTIYQSLVACWFLFMTVPELSTAEGIPHGLRLIGVIPPMFILAAWGVNWLWQKMPQGAHFKPEKIVAGFIFISIIFVYNFVLYFGVAASSPDYAYAYRSDLTVVSNYLNERNLKNRTYLSLDDYSVQTVEYLTTDKNQPYILVDPAKTFEVQLKRGDQVVFTQSTIFDRIKFLQFHPTAKLINQVQNQFGEIIMLIYQQP